MFERLDTHYILFDKLVERYKDDGDYFKFGTTGQIYLLKHKKTG